MASVNRPTAPSVSRQQSVDTVDGGASKRRQTLGRRVNTDQAGVGGLGSGYEAPTQGGGMLGRGSQISIGGAVRRR